MDFRTSGLRRRRVLKNLPIRQQPFLELRIRDVLHRDFPIDRHRRGGGIHRKITSITANVPAGCGHTGADLKRSPGWPGLVNKWSGKDEAKLRTASMYYDVVNFARRVKCPTLIGMGLIDTVCPAPGIFAAYSQITAPKRIVIMPLADHMGSHNPYYPVMGAWWGAAREGKELPLK